jgi:hypothetical protein
MADEIHEIETRLASLRARKQRWLTRYDAVEHAQGKARERAQCKATSESTFASGEAGSWD